MTMVDYVCGTGGWSGPLPGDPDNNVILSATAVFGGIQVSWTYPSINPHAVAHTLLYRGVTADFTLAPVHKVVQGDNYYDQIDSLDEGTYFYWISIVSINGTPGEVIGPASATAVSRTVEILDALTGQLTESKLHASLQTKIDKISLLDADLYAETLARIADSASIADAFATMQTDLEDTSALVFDEVAARQAALLAESTARSSAISGLNTQIQADIAAGDAAVVSTITSNYQLADAATLANAYAYTYSKAQADSAIAASATTLTSAYQAADAATLSSAQTFTYSRSAIDAADAAVLSTVRAEFASGDSATLASAQNYTYSKATIDSAIATEVSTLRSQVTGGSTATDLNALTSGLIYQERTTRSAIDTSLAQQIALLSAGSGEQFDYQAIWYFDTTVEGWTSPVAGTVLSAAGGWLRLVSGSGTVSDPYFRSPDNLGIDGATYPRVQARTRKVGAPTWDGKLYYTTVADPTWNEAKSVNASAPTYDANGISIVVWDMSGAWLTSTIKQLRFDLSTTVTTADYFEIDWAAIGRPSPGASSAQLLEEQLARADGDSAQTLARETLAAQLRGTYTGTDIASLTSGLVHSEREARVSADAAEASSRTSLATQMRGTYTGTALASLTSGLLYDERQARSTADGTEVTARQSLSAKVTGSNDPTGLTLATLSSGLLFDEKSARATADSTEVTARQSLSTKVTGAADPTSLSLATLSSGLLFDERTARSTADSSQAGRLDVLEATVNNATTGVTATASALDSVETLVYNGTTGVAANATKVSLLDAKVATTKGIFTETWESPIAVDQWVLTQGAGERTILSASDAALGGKYLRVGNNSGNDMAWTVHKELIPFDPAKTYKITVVARRPTGAGTLYVGWAGVAADGVTYVNAAGANIFSDQHYHAAAAAAPGTGWTTYTGYTQGHALSTGSAGVGTIVNPGKMHPNVRYLRPLLLANYNGATGQMDIDSIVIEYADAEVRDNELTAAILSEQTVRADADSVLADDITTLESRLTSGGDVGSAIVQSQSTATTALTNAGSALTAANNAQIDADAAQTTASGAVIDAAAAQTTANTAVTNAATAQTAANTANSTLADIASDSKLTPVEKSAVRAEWDVIAGEKAGINTQATTFSITTENTTYNTKFQALATYLNNAVAWSSGVPTWVSDANLAVTTTIVGATFRTTFKEYYDARTALLNAIAVKAKTLADAAQVSANSKIQTFYQAEAPTATSVGDLWVDTDDNNRVYRWNSAIWQDAHDARITTTASQVTTLQTSIAGKTSTYRQAAVPTGAAVNVGDLWIDTGSQNRCLHSEDFSQTVWTKGSNVYGPDTVVSPVDGSVLTLVAAVTALRPSQAVTRIVGKSYVTSVRVKAGTSNWFRLRSNAIATWFDLSTGTVGQNNCDAAGIINEGNGIYRCWVQEVQTSATYAVEMHSTSANNSTTAFGTMYMGAVQVEEDVTLPSRYIKTLGTMVSTVGNNTLLAWNGANWVITDNALLAANTAALEIAATSIDGLEAQYTVKIDNNGYVTGYGLASTAVNGTPTSEFAVVADKFSIAPVATDNAAADGSPFFHLTASTTINGVSVPAGTYMKSAYIHNASITNAQIGNVIQSSNFVTGTSGWKLDKAGNMELNAAVFRGTIDVKSATTNARLEIKNNVIKVYDSANVLRVRIGDLTA